MSKEQTPITAEELSKILYGKSKKEIQRRLEQYAQAKALEALEREFKNYENNNPHKGHIEYYETEVKPKYK